LTSTKACAAIFEPLAASALLCPDRWDIAKLLSSPCHSATKAGDSIVLQLTPEFQDIEIALERLDAARTAVIDHLGANSFLRGEGEDEQRDVPLFRLHE
jgi:hypothetical protein